MKIYSFGQAHAPVLLLLPGTCCYWKSNFGHVIPLLEREFRVLCVSYDGFDETERTEFPTMTEEAGRIEDRLLECGCGHIRAAYGCSLGGSFVGLLAARRRIRMDYGILGSSDLDQASGCAAKLQTELLVPLIYPLIRDGQFKSRFLQKRLERRMGGMAEYGTALMKLFGGARPYVTQRSCQSQFYSDLITPLPDGIDVPGTEEVCKKLAERVRADSIAAAGGDEFADSPIDPKLYCISALTGKGVDSLKAAIATKVHELREEARAQAANQPEFDHVWEHKREMRDRRFTVRKLSEGVFRVVGTQVERMVVQCDCEVLEVTDRRVRFGFRVYDDVTEVAGGDHERYLVDAERFLKKAESKI